MADISQIQVGSATKNIADAYVRDQLANKANLSGATLTGSLTIAQPYPQLCLINTSRSVNTTVTADTSWIINRKTDAAGHVIFYSYAIKLPSGNNQITWGARRLSADGGVINNTLVFEARSDNVYYSVTQPYIWRDAMGAAASSSDRRLKSNITPLNKQDSMNFIKQLKPYEYDMNNKHQIGFIAQNVNKIDIWKTNIAFPTHKGLNKWEKMPDGSKVWKLNYPRLITPMISSLQKILCEMEDLEKKIQQLENKE